MQRLLYHLDQRDVLVKVFVPSLDRDRKQVDQEHFVQRTVKFLSQNLGGATALPRAWGGWWDPLEQKLYTEHTVIIESYTKLSTIVEMNDRINYFCELLRQKMNQSAIAIVVGDRLTYIMSDEDHEKLKAEKWQPVDEDGWEEEYIPDEPPDSY